MLQLWMGVSASTICIYIYTEILQDIMGYHGIYKKQYDLRIWGDLSGLGSASIEVPFRSWA